MLGKSGVHLNPFDVRNYLQETNGIMSVTHFEHDSPELIFLLTETHVYTFWKMFTVYLRRHFEVAESISAVTGSWLQDGLYILGLRD